MLPVRPIVYPTVLTGLANGRLPDDVLVGVDGGRLVAPAAAAWNRMVAAAARDGIDLHPSSPNDTYRPYEVQERIFLDRYTTEWLPGQPSRVWNNERWWQKYGTATAAVPGTSNHGLGLAVDVGDVEQGGRLDWLLGHADSLGWTWELDSEPWHVRYVNGDAGGDDDMTDEQAAQLAQVHAALAFLRAEWAGGSTTDGGTAYPNIPTLMGWTLDNAQAARVHAEQINNSLNPDVIADRVAELIGPSTGGGGITADAVKQAVKDALSDTTWLATTSWKTS